MKKFKLTKKQMKEIKNIKYSGSKEGFLAKVAKFAKQKKVMFMSTFALVAAIMVPGQSAFADEVTPEVVDVNEGVTPIEQTTELPAPETALTDELANAGATVNEETVVEQTEKEETPEVETPEVETPEVETPEVETPEVETPEVETPEVETPEVETPEVETPEVETPEVEETTDQEIEDAKDEKDEKDGFLEIIDGESHKNPGSVTLPSAGDNSNPMGIVISGDGSSIGIFSPVEAMSLDEVNQLITNLINSKLVGTGISKDVVIKILSINPDVNEPVVYDLSKYGLGNIVVSKNADGTYSMSFDGSVDIEVVTATVTNDKNHSLDPDTTDVYKAAPEEPTPTPEPEPTPEPPTEQFVPSGLPQTGDDNLALLLGLGGLALGAGATMSRARRRMR